MFIVRSEGLARRIGDLNTIVVAHEDGTPVYLSDVAEVAIGGEVRQGLETMNGETEVVSGMVIQLYGTNSSTAMYYFGISANLMSLGGLAIAIGMMVDGAIVMTENVDRLLRRSEESETKLHLIARACSERPSVLWPTRSRSRCSDP